MEKVYLFSFMILMLSGCNDKYPKPADIDATTETINLFQSMWLLQQQGVMYGHQDDLLYGQTWWNEEDRSDTKDFIGDYPAVAGFELGHIEHDSIVSLDGVSFERITEQVKNHYKRGGVITISWHADNPLTIHDPGEGRQAGSAWDVTSTEVVSSILPGGDNNMLFNVWLDRLAAHLNTYVDDKGTPIPFIFRPYHEHSGDFFWWGSGICTDDEYIALWRYTVSYLKTKGLHNILYAYNTDRVTSLDQYLKGYPGDEIIDVLSLDMYDRGDVFAREVDTALKFVTETAILRNKLTALSETSNGSRRIDSWWSGIMLPILSKYPVGYVLTWRHTYRPVIAGQDGSSQQIQHQSPFSYDFVNFYNSDRSLFLKEITSSKTVYEKNR